MDGSNIRDAVSRFGRFGIDELNGRLLVDMGNYPDAVQNEQASMDVSRIFDKVVVGILSGGTAETVDGQEVDIAMAYGDHLVTERRRMEAMADCLANKEEIKAGMYAATRSCRLGANYLREEGMEFLYDIMTIIRSGLPVGAEARHIDAVLNLYVGGGSIEDAFAHAVESSLPKQVELSDAVAYQVTDRGRAFYDLAAGKVSQVAFSTVAEAECARVREAMRLDVIDGLNRRLPDVLMLRACRLMLMDGAVMVSEPFVEELRECYGTLGPSDDAKLADEFYLAAVEQAETVTIRAGGLKVTAQAYMKAPECTFVMDKQEEALAKAYKGKEVPSRKHAAPTPGAAERDARAQAAASKAKEAPSQSKVR